MEWDADCFCLLLDSIITIYFKASPLPEQIIRSFVIVSVRVMTNPIIVF